MRRRFTKYSALSDITGSLSDITKSFIDITKSNFPYHLLFIDINT